MISRNNILPTLLLVIAAVTLVNCAPAVPCNVAGNGSGAARLHRSSSKDICGNGGGGGSGGNGSDSSGGAINAESIRVGGGGGAGGLGAVLGGSGAGSGATGGGKASGGGGEPALFGKGG